MLGNTRDLGFSHGAGKGDANRSDSKAFRDGYGNIDWGRKWSHPVPYEGFRFRGQKLVKRYGGTAPTTIEQLRQLITNP